MKTATKGYYKEEETVWHIKDMELLTLIEKSNQALPCDINKSYSSSDPEVVSYVFDKP